jgi:transcriptional regulator with GAF, ATPase, and Fis domain
MDLNQLFSEMALELEAHETIDGALDTIAQYARVAVDADDAGIMIVHGKQVETPVATSKEVAHAHDLQAELNEGPCLQAVTGGEHTYLVRNTLEDDRWPTWGKAAADLGYHSSISSSMETTTRRYGSLNIYSRKVDAFDDEDVAVTKMLAAHASVAVAASRTRSELYTALGTRTTIGQAQGILMNAFDIDSDQAFAYMQRISQHQNIKLFKVAQTVIDSRDDLGTINKAVGDKDPND